MVNWPLSRRYGWRGLPGGIQVQVRVGVLLQQTDEDLGHDPPADRAQLAALADDLGLLQDVEPQRGLAAPSRIREEVLEALVLPRRTPRGPSPRCRRSGSPPRCGGSVHNWAVVSGVTPISRATCCPEGRPIFLPRRRFRCDSRPRVLVSGSAVCGQLEQRVGQRSVELAHGPGSRASARASVEELAPLNLQPGQQLAVPVQVVVGGRVLEQRHARDRAQERVAAVENIPDGVAGSGHAVAEAVRGHSELDRDEGAPRRVRRLVVLDGDLRGPGRTSLYTESDMVCPTMAGRNSWVTIHW